MQEFRFFLFFFLRERAINSLIAIILLVFTNQLEMLNVSFWNINAYGSPCDGIIRRDNIGEKKRRTDTN